jgi:DNA-binding transcriptional LysR family regulator
MNIERKILFSSKMTSTKKLLQRRHIEALVAVGDGLSVHRAARDLGVPQPVLSRLLAEAEAVLGARLFERSSHGSKPTPQGQGVLAHARFVLRAIERLNSVIAEARPTIQLGCIPRAMHTLMPVLLSNLYPVASNGEVQAAAMDAGFHFRVVEGSSKMLFDAISAGSLDFAILRSPARNASADDDLVVERLYDERTVVICAADHPDIPDSPVALSRLASHGWALPDPETTSRVAFDAFWDEHGLPQIRPVIETRSFESNLAVVAGTRLISIAPESIARSHVSFGDLRIVKVRRALPGNPVMLAFNRMAEEDPGLNDFRRMIHDTARALALT